MNKIKEYLDSASEAYYNGMPFITDEVFDKLADSIQYDKVGAKQHEHLCKHYTRMFSLQKYYDGDKTRPLAEFGANDKVTTPKLDGAAVSVLYINGELSQVLTRGNGVEGTDITDKFLATNIIPHKIDTLLDIVQITGEIAAVKEIPNARNYAAGSLSLKDIAEFRTRAVSFFAYGVYPFLTTTFTEDMKRLSKFGFSTILDRNLSEIYPCDGLVVRLNDNVTFQELGYTSKHPRGAYALKERNEATETIILDVEWQVGKSGKVTPVAILEPVMIGDALVSRATLNNVGFINMLDLQIGDTVGVVRSGDIIPCIVSKVDA